MADNFQKECDSYVVNIAKKLIAIYNGEVDSEENEGEKMDLREYFYDYLDVDYIVNSSKEYQSARIWVTIGGPGVYIDTETASVKLTWGSNKAEAYLPYDVRDEIDDIFSEYYSIS